MSDPVQLTVLIAIIAGFVSFGITLFVVSVHANLPKPAPTEPLPRKVIPASGARSQVQT